ncbi:MAG: hypothetical protein OEZ13_13345 [Spirochaetia bacterium]|nr:hypothetical protein [Spirochaetia bacterium]
MKTKKYLFFSMLMIAYMFAFNISLLAQQQDTDKANDEKLVNRRVLILDFTNAQNNKNFSYLEVSIPDAFLDPLDKTKSFELLKRNVWQKMVKAGLFDREDAYDEDVAIEAAKKSGADVVVIGMFVVSGQQMQMFSKAIEVSSGRVIVNRTKRTNVDSNMFEAIDKLALGMSKEMKEKLPPVKQKVLERVKYIDSGKITYTGMIWRTALIPGWGHTYAIQKRGYLYMAFWAASAGVFGYFAYDTAAKKEIYEGETSLVEIEKKYDAYNSSFKMQGYSFYVLISAYVFALSDIAIFGKGYSSKSQKLGFSFAPDLNISLNKREKIFHFSMLNYRF